MKFFERIETRLAVLTALVVIFTNLITYGITSYTNQRNFRELPRDVQDFLEFSNNPPLPMQISRQIQSVLLNGSELGVRLQTTPREDKLIYSLRPLTLSNAAPLKIEITSIPPPRDRTSFRARLEHSLLLATLISGILGVLLALIFARRLARPIEAISRAANRLAKGDLKARISNPQGQDETAHLARNFNHMAEFLEQSENQRRALVADVAHELRTPLTVMQGRLESIQDGVIPLEMPEIDRLHRQAGYLARIVEDLRTLTLANEGRLSLELASRDLRQVLQGVGSSFQSLAAAKQVRLEVKMPDHPLTLPLDATRLAQIAGNLINNALTHTPEGGEIRLEAHKDRLGIHFSVTDSGPGIPAEAIPKLFDRFYRVEGSRSRQTGGSGLGLAIVKALVELHRGSVIARNNPQGGAEFRVSLPLVSDTHPLGAVKARANS